MMQLWKPDTEDAPSPSLHIEQGIPTLRELFEGVTSNMLAAIDAGESADNVGARVLYGMAGCTIFDAIAWAKGCFTVAGREAQQGKQESADTIRGIGHYLLMMVAPAIIAETAGLPVEEGREYAKSLRNELCSRHLNSPRRTLSKELIIAAPRMDLIDQIVHAAACYRLADSDTEHGSSVRAKTMQRAGEQILGIAAETVGAMAVAEIKQYGHTVH